ncbi:hypothetical protein [EBPR siphovirus 2]|nr:hypothetical protein [EBPR siphovirus 2]
MSAPIVFIGMETSGAFRQRFRARGWNAISADLLPAEDDGEGHIQDDVDTVLDYLFARGLWPSLAIFHPTCTYLTNSAEWAFSDPDFERYPGVGYHQRVKSDTLTGAARRAARAAALEDIRRWMHLPIQRKVFENPRGAIATAIRPVDQIVQPYQFGDDASKATCFWFCDKHGQPLPDMRIPLNPARFVPPTLRPNGKRYWGNQTDTGQNRLSPGPDRWKERSRTYPGLADAAVAHWSYQEPRGVFT